MVQTAFDDVEPHRCDGFGRGSAVLCACKHVGELLLSRGALIQALHEISAASGCHLCVHKVDKEVLDLILATGRLTI